MYVHVSPLVLRFYTKIWVIRSIVWGSAAVRLGHSNSSANSSVMRSSTTLGELRRSLGLNRVLVLFPEKNGFLAGI